MIKISSLMTVVLLCIAPSVAAQDTPDVESQLALAVAQVCANEASLNSLHPADCALIWQATRSHGSTAEERLAWLTRHSSCVLTDRDMTEREARGNCRWTRYLTDSDVQPEGWPSDVLWSNHSERWATVRRHCRGLVAGRVPAGGFPCPSDPDTWGGTMDHERALRRGMTPVGCHGTANEGYRFAPWRPTPS